MVVIEAEAELAAGETDRRRTALDIEAKVVARPRMSKSPKPSKPLFWPALVRHSVLASLKAAGVVKRANEYSLPLLLLVESTA